MIAGVGAVDYDNIHLTLLAADGLVCHGGCVAPAAPGQPAAEAQR